ncbi:DNA fragmentation factor subunit alpha [Eurytemora carolleeae]|uniref:DNA fragmentation factor subunit alpha n=1 Tax=Eurytemora carolleeae TaxID=1294199 RepID=UPI000C75CF2A|nr:DNA fragmentation factor subunit alpha [Eurytemora carolleeae]
MSSSSGKKKPFKVLDRTRTRKKGIMVDGLDDLLIKAKTKFEYPTNQSVELVLEEDGTEIEDEDYLFSLPDNTCLMLLFKEEKWSPFGVGDEVDSVNPSSALFNLLLRLESSPGSIALMSEPDLELLVDIDPEQQAVQHPRFDLKFLKDVQTAADKHLLEKGEIRDTLALLDIYHKTKSKGLESNPSKTESSKDKKSNREGSSVPKRRKH